MEHWSQVPVNFSSEQKIKDASPAGARRAPRTVAQWTSYLSQNLAAVRPFSCLAEGQAASTKVVENAKLFKKWARRRYTVFQGGTQRATVGSEPGRVPCGQFSPRRAHFLNNLVFSMTEAEAVATRPFPPPFLEA